MTRILLALVAALTLVACGGPKRTLSYTYTKDNITQLQLLDDEKLLKKADGVRQVIPKIDEKGTARIEVIVDEREKAPGLELLTQLGYKLVTN